MGVEPDRHLYFDHIFSLFRLCVILKSNDHFAVDGSAGLLSSLLSLRAFGVNQASLLQNHNIRRDRRLREVESFGDGVDVLRTIRQDLEDLQTNL